MAVNNSVGRSTAMPNGGDIESSVAGRRRSLACG